MILVDTNILVDISGNDSRWASRSAAALADAFADFIPTINDIVFSEFSVGYSSTAACLALLEVMQIKRSSIPDEALFLAAKTHLEYRRRGGIRTGTLPDFFIGAHAAVLGIPVLSRDKGRYEAYFPGLTVMRP